MTIKYPILKCEVIDFFIFSIRNYMVIDRLFNDFRKFLPAFCKHSILSFIFFVKIIII